ncbi:MAG TPA: ROK family protein, partial [Ohtaekwangia sp.]|nr:ROK family protein [Ohtaekwangia sp.]
MGHMIAEENGRVCNTKRKGCLEAYASVTGIRRTVFSLLSSSVERSTLRTLSFEELTGEHITKAAAAGDPIALEAFEYTGRILGKALANAISILDPEAIFVGGGLARAGDFLFKPTKKYIDQNVFPAFEGKVPLLPSALLDANGGLTGACAMAWAQLRNNKT